MARAADLSTFACAEATNHGYGTRFHDDNMPARKRVTIFLLRVGCDWVLDVRFRNAVVFASPFFVQPLPECLPWTNAV